MKKLASLLTINGLVPIYAFKRHKFSHGLGVQPIPGPTSPEPFQIDPKIQLF